MAQITIQRLGHLGDGIGNGPVFAARTLPGEVVEGEIDRDRIVKPRILTPSKDRISAPCKHAKSCGGCALQHASDSFVEAWKTQVVVEALSAHGIEAPIRHVQTSASGTRRRATFTGRRTKSGAVVGFHGAASDQIHGVPKCLLLRPALLNALPDLEKITHAGTSRKGELRLTLTETDSGLDLSVSNGKPLDIALNQTVAGLVEKADFARVSWNDEPFLQRRKPVLWFGAAPVTPPAGSFLQATSSGEAALLSAVEDALVKTKGPIVDLFSGCGTFGLPMASRYEVHAVEGEDSMLQALDDGWRHSTGLHDVTTECRDLFRRPLLQDELSKFSAAIIDPPRAGAEAQTAELAKARIPHIAFVSCNPVTFARDAATLVRSGYVLSWVDVIDQFRWSTHVEIAASFTHSDM